MIGICVQIMPGSSCSDIYFKSNKKIPSNEEIFSNLSILQENKEAESTVASLIALHRTNMCSKLILRIQTAPYFLCDLRYNMHSCPHVSNIKSKVWSWTVVIQPTIWGCYDIVAWLKTWVTFSSHLVDLTGIELSSCFIQCWRLLVSTASGSDVERSAPLPFSPNSPQSFKVAQNTCIFFPSSMDYLFRSLGSFSSSVWSLYEVPRPALDHQSAVPGSALIACLSKGSTQASTSCPSKYSAQPSTQFLSIKVQCPAQHSLPDHESMGPDSALYCLSIKVQCMVHFLEEITPLFHRGSNVPGFEPWIRYQESWLLCITFLLCLKRAAGHRG